MTTIWVGIGGALGSIARYHLGRIATTRASTFPWGTLLVNLLGCLALGVLMQLATRGRIDEDTRIAIGVGVLGGFTTYSTFNHETLALLQGGAYARAGAYVAATLLGSLALGWAGWLLARGG